MRYILLFLIPFSLYASKILSYNIYDRTDRADVMITFDTPYNGSLKQSTTSSKIIIKLQDAEIESSKIKNVSSRFLKQLTITPMRGYTKITADIPSNIKLVASKTSDAYGLRLRFVPKTNLKQQLNTSINKTNNNLTTKLPTKRSDEFTSSYYIVITILIIGILILFIIKRKTQNSLTPKKKDSWLFQPNKDQTSTTLNTQNNPIENSVSILFQKQINETNSVVMLSFMNESYLVLMGNSNILLDKFHDNKPSTEQEFETILQDRNQQLEDFLGHNSNIQEKNKVSQQVKEPFQAYTERAASIAYSDEL